MRKDDERRSTKEAWDPRDLAVRSIVFHFDTQIDKDLLEHVYP